MKNSIKHILVIRLSALGDVAMLIPVLRVLAKTYPDLKLTVLTRPFFSPLFENLNNVSVYHTDLKGKHKGLLGLWKLANEIKKLKPDAIADCHNVLRTNIIKWICGIRPFIQIDKGRSEKKELIKGKRFEQLKTTQERYADVFQLLGFEVDLDNIEFPPKSAIPSSIKSLLGTSRPLVGIAPFAAHKSKCYPLDKMEKVIEALMVHHSVVLFGGGEEESGLLQKLYNRHPAVINLAGKVSFKEELELIQNLDLMIAMDSGNGHLAAAYGVNTITIWGATHPYAGFAPFKQHPENNILVDRAKFPLIPTSIYGNKFPAGYENAIGSIEPERIISRALKLLKD